MANVSKKTTGSRKAGTRRKTTNVKKKNTRSTTSQAENNALKKEIVVLLAFACSILLFLSNLNKGGIVGEILRGGMLGLFGVVGYLVPLLLFIGTCFYISNRNNPKAVIKIVMFGMVAILFCGIYQIITGGTYDPSLKLTDYYTLSITGKYGGLIGGLFVKLLVPTFGVIGSFVIIFVPLLAGIVIITEKSLVDFIGKRSSEAYQYAREDMHRLKEDFIAKQEERQRYRAEQKVKGVAFNTGLHPEKQEAITLKPQVSSSVPVRVNPSTADVFIGEIHLPEEITQADYDDLDRLLPNSSEISSIMAEREKRTLKEMEELEQGAVRETEEIFMRVPDPILAEEEEVEEVFIKPAPLIEVKKIVTASGKVIEIEEDPPEAYPLYSESRGLKAEEPPVNKESAASKELIKKEAIKTPQKSKSLPKPARDYKFPPLQLLSRGEKQSTGGIDIELRETAIKLQQTLQNFGVAVTVTNISCGPSVTRYELHPEQGVKVSKIVSLADDIKLNLAAADIRIEAPIPGKAAVGIEVPNKENQIVHFRSLLESPEFQKHPSGICFGVGKDIAGQTVIADIGKMPHLLIAGATGSGKSVCINTLIMSVLYKANPSDVKLIMIDPKVVELSVYNGIPHLLIPVVTDPKKAAGALNWAVAEMSDRYKKFAEYNVRDLKGYNEKVASIKDIEDENKPEKLPQIIIIVDELADLMMVAPGEVEDAICRLAQLARAAGIHLVIATQRPSVNVITGLIKANVPSRIAFSVSSGVDSRTIIDMNGAEKLLGKGDMLFYPAGYQKPLRVQGAFISDHEVTEVVDFLIKQGITDEYSTELEAKISSAGGQESGSGGGSEEQDAYFVQSARFIIEKDKASIGMLQRNFRIGFNRAARIMDQLSESGIVGEEEGTKPRKILITMEELNSLLGEE